VSEVKQLEREVLKFLETRNNSWVFFFGAEKLDKDDTIKRFKKDKKFRGLVLTLAVKRAIDSFKVETDEVPRNPPKV